MGSITVEAFKWTGTYYDATYSTSYQATIRDNDDHFDGGDDRDERVSIDGGPPQSTSGSPYAIKIDFEDASGDSHEEVFQFFNTGGSWYFIPGPDSEFSVGAHLGNYQSHTVGWDYDSVVCFVQGTLIATPDGPVPVETLVAGDAVCRLDGSVARLRARLTRRLSAFDLRRNPRLRPVLIRAHALAPGRPSQDLRVSRQHRMLLASPVAKRMFGSSEALVAAVRLTALPGVEIEDRTGGVVYEHLVFDAHEIVIANGTPSESLFPGPEALKALPDEMREEMEALFQGLAAPTGAPARFIPKGRQQKRLLDRLNQNGKAAVDPDHRWDGI